MYYITDYQSPLGKMVLTSNGSALTNAQFEQQDFFATQIENSCETGRDSVLRQAVRWLDIYFSKGEPGFSVPLHLEGTAFQIKVWKIVSEIPYGQTASYRQIAQKLSAGMSAQAVGNAVKHNRLLLFIPCHRVIRADGQLSGYAGKADRKRALLERESITSSRWKPEWDNPS